MFFVKELVNKIISHFSISSSIVPSQRISFFNEERTQLEVGTNSFIYRTYIGNSIFNALSIVNNDDNDDRTMIFD